MKYNKIIFFSCCLLTLFSCKKVIESKETDVIPGELALTTVSYCEQGVIGGYASINPDMPIHLNATFSDEVKKSEFYNAGTTHEWQYGTVDVVIRDNFTAIYPLYQLIDRVNRVLVAIPKADSTRQADSAFVRRRVRGEAYFLRAWGHFELFRYYSGNYHPDSLAMVYMDAPSPDILLPFARIKMAPYFTRLKADLDSAKTILQSTLTDINRATRTAVSGLQARVALYQRDWAAAETYSTEFINAIPLASAAQFPGIWTDANTSEIGWRIVRTSGLSRLGSIFRGTSASGSNIGTVSWAPSNKLWTAYDPANDLRFNAYLKDEPLLTNVGRPSKIVKKYAGTAYGTTNENVANAKMLRTGEMYLIRAEARAEQNKITGANSAESDINALRTARITGYTNVTFADKTDAMAAIVTERFKELAFEGHRFWDLRRWNLPVQRNPEDAPTATAATLPAGNFRFILPIPNTEIQANKLIVQNAGY